MPEPTTINKIIISKESVLRAGGIPKSVLANYFVAAGRFLFNTSSMKKARVREDLLGPAFY